MTDIATSSDSSVAMLDRSNPTNALLVGLDLGTNTTCIEFADSSKAETELSELIPSLVGYARPGILPDVIPGNETTLFGTDALNI
jgi:rod shape-determining protein MreB